MSHRTCPSCGRLDLKLPRNDRYECGCGWVTAYTYAPPSVREEIDEKNSVLVKEKGYPSNYVAMPKHWASEKFIFWEKFRDGREIGMCIAISLQRLHAMAEEA